MTFFNDGLLPGTVSQINLLIAKFLLVMVFITEAEKTNEDSATNHNIIQKLLNHIFTSDLSKPGAFGKG